VGRAWERGYHWAAFDCLILYHLEVVWLHNWVGVPHRLCGCPAAQPASSMWPDDVYAGNYFTL